MLFNSLVFLLFGIAFFAAWPVLRRGNNIRWIFITAASFLFYGWWDWRFLFLIVLSGLIDYAAALVMEGRPARRRLILLVSMLGNIGTLAVFKYSGFFAENLDAIFALVGLATDLKANIPNFMLITPVGISFYTFQSMSYTIDVYRGELKPTKNVFHFFAYLSLFPQLVAGPIVRARDLLPQLEHPGYASDEQRWDGLKLIVYGFFKKVVVADNLAPIVNAAFGSAAPETSTLYWWIIVTMFGFQIYCDFSGYSDIARGLAKWMGYEFNVNFDHPYVSQSLREFWARWHISLSTWFRDYVYIPLGGNKVRVSREYGNIWVTMLISGLWHGAAWTFVIWAAIHAFFISIERLTGWTKAIKRLPLGGFLATLIILVQVWVSWVFFRAESFTQAVSILKWMFVFNLESFHVVDDVLFAKALFLTGVMVVGEAFVRFGLNRFRLQPVSWQPLTSRVILAVMIALCVFLRGPGAEFIYFQF